MDFLRLAIFGFGATLTIAVIVGIKFSLTAARFWKVPTVSIMRVQFLIPSQCRRLHANSGMEYTDFYSYSNGINKSNLPYEWMMGTKNEDS